MNCLNCNTEMLRGRLSSPEPIVWEGNGELVQLREAITAHRCPQCGAVVFLS